MLHKVVTVTMNPALDRTYTVEGFTTEKLNIARSVRMDAGGKGINVARALRNFGVDVVATGLNGGFTGKYLESLIEKEGIPVDFFTVDGETRINVKISDNNTGATTELNERGFQVTDEILTGFLNKLDELASQAEYLVLCGRLPQGADAGIYGEIIRKYRKKGVRVILDADSDALKLGVKETPFAVKPNLKELSCIAGKQVESDRDVIREARALIDSGIELVAVTMGERGVILVSGSEVYKARPFPIRIANATGAGDAALAAMIYCLINGSAPDECAAYMVCAGTLSAALQGTGACGLDELSGYVSKVGLEPIPMLNANIIKREE